MLNIETKRSLMETYNLIRAAVPTLAGSCYIFSPILYLNLIKISNKLKLELVAPELHVGNIIVSGTHFWDQKRNNEQCSILLNYKNERAAALNTEVEFHLWIKYGQTLIDPTVRDLISSLSFGGEARDVAPLIEDIDSKYLIYNRTLSYETHGVLNLDASSYPKLISVLTGHPMGEICEIIGHRLYEKIN